MNRGPVQPFLLDIHSPAAAFPHSSCLAVLSFPTLAPDPTCEQGSEPKPISTALCSQPEPPREEHKSFAAPFHQIRVFLGLRGGVFAWNRS